MKFLKINTAISVLAAFILITSFMSCTDDDVFELEDNTVTFSEFGVNFEEGGALVAVSDIVGGFYDFAQGGNGVVGFTLDDFGADATSVNIYKSYNGGTPVLHSTVNSLPSTVSISLAEAVDGLVNLDDVQLLDQIVYSFDITTAGGTFPSGATVVANVSCVSELAGEYMAETTGQSTDGCCPGTVMTSGPVTLTELGGGEYTISDWSGNIYFVWYGPDGGNYGITEDYVNGGGMNATISDVCDEISATFDEPFGTSTTLTGSVDEMTGVITFSWVTGYDDQATVVLTPQ